MNANKKLKKSLSFLLGIFFIAVNVYSSEDWTQIWDRLEQEKILSSVRGDFSRTILSEKLLDDLSQISSTDIKISAEQKKQLDLLIENFRDELFLLEQKEKAYLLEKRSNTLVMNNPTSGRLLFRGQQVSNHPEETDEVKFYQDVHLDVQPSTQFRGFLGLRNSADASSLTSGSQLEIDEGYVQASVGEHSSVSIGRIYFVLDRLGLIADNYFDAFEGIKSEVALPSGFSFSCIYSRLSSTNYPYKNFLMSSDDYWAFRLTGLKEKGVEVGLTYLHSGIATEKASAVDLYIPIGERELIGEFALYWPSETDYTAIGDAKLAGVLGLDLYKSLCTNIFLQVGSVENGFTPMASSLIYSAGSHLYFDQNTLGYDLTFTYQPQRRLEKKIDEVWETRLDRFGFFTALTSWEFEIVGLKKQNFSPHSYQFIFRNTHSIAKGLTLNFEDVFWVRKSTILYPETDYNQLRLAVSFNF